MSFHEELHQTEKLKPLQYTLVTFINNLINKKKKSFDNTNHTTTYS